MAFKEHQSLDILFDLHDNTSILKIVCNPQYFAEELKELVILLKQLVEKSLSINVINLHGITKKKELIYFIHARRY